MSDIATLRFLTAVQRHTKTAATLMGASGLSPEDLQPAVAKALEAGFVETTGQIHPVLRLTDAGLALAMQGAA